MGGLAYITESIQACFPGNEIQTLITWSTVLTHQSLIHLHFKEAKVKNLVVKMPGEKSTKPITCKFFSLNSTSIWYFSKFLRLQPPRLGIYHLPRKSEESVYHALSFLGLSCLICWLMWHVDPTPVLALPMTRGSPTVCEVFHCTLFSSPQALSVAGPTEIRSA